MNTLHAQYTLNAQPTSWRALPDHVRLSSVTSFRRRMSCRSCDCCASMAFSPAISAWSDLIFEACGDEVNIFETKPRESCLVISTTLSCVWKDSRRARRS